MKALARTAAPPLDEARAKALAQSLHRAAVAWAHTFLKSRSGLDPKLADALATETLAFGLVLLAERLRWHGASALPFLNLAREQAWRLHARWRKRPAGLRRLLAGPAEAGDVSEFTIACRAQHGGAGNAFQFTEAMHAEFCELTGLGTNELVGHGANLSSLLFYLVVHGRVFAGQTQSREDRRWLVQASRDCREFLERALEDWLAAPIAGERPVSARIGR